jgi:hypothetical protein
MRAGLWGAALLASAAVFTGCLSPGGEVRLSSAKARQQAPPPESPGAGGDPIGPEDPEESETPLALAVPVNVRVTGVTDASVSLAWDASAGAAQYRIYRRGVSVGQVAQTSFSDLGLVASTRYEYEIEAVGSAGSTSYRSAPVAATTAPASGSTNPSMVSVSLNPSISGEAPPVSVLTTSALTFSLQLSDSGSGLAGARFFRYVAKELSEAQRASPECQALSVADQTQATAVSRSLCTAGGAPLQEIFYLGEWIAFSAAQRVPGVSVTFSQAVPASSLGTGTHQLGVWMSDRAGIASMVTRVVTVQ